MESLQPSLIGVKELVLCWNISWLFLLDEENYNSKNNRIIEREGEQHENKKI